MQFLLNLLENDYSFAYIIQQSRYHLYGIQSNNNLDQKYADPAQKYSDYTALLCMRITDIEICEWEPDNKNEINSFIIEIWICGWCCRWYEEGTEPDPPSLSSHLTQRQ